MTLDTLRGLSRHILRRSRVLRFNVKRAVGLTDRPTLVVYPGHVTGGRLKILARVLEDDGVFDAPHSDSTLRNLWLTFKRYETDEIGGARVRFEGPAGVGAVRSAIDGYVSIEIDASHLAEDAAPWTPLKLTLEKAAGYDFEPVEAEGRARVVSRAARFGVISDIDDTIIHTGAFKLLRHWRIVTANSPEARAAFPGVSEFYRALCEGATGPETNPVFYVSSSPWNLSDIFERFMALKGIPAGPMFLRSLSSDAMGWILKRHRSHKAVAIDEILAAYPDLGFVLIGDSGQKDATVYAAAVERHPGRILGVHIHDVRPTGIVSDEVERELKRIEAAGVPTTLGRTLGNAAAHAEGAGLVAPGTHAAVLREIAGEADKPERFGRFPVIVQP